MRRLGALAAGAVMVGVLGGCVPTGSQSSGHNSRPAAPVVTPSATPAAPAVTPSATPGRAEPESPGRVLTVTAEFLTVTTDDGTPIAEFDYFQPTEDVIVGMSELFGIKPARERFEGGEGHAQAQTSWEWDGFFLIDEDGPGDPPLDTDYFVAVTVPAVGEVDIETVDGIQVGNDAATIERRYPDQAHRVTAGDQRERLDVHVGAVTLPPPGDGADPPGANGRYEFSVWLLALDPNGTITEFRAPSPNFGV